MNQTAIFVRETSPSIVAIDPLGRRHPLANPEDGVKMLAALDQIQEMSGAKHVTCAVNPEGRGDAAASAPNGALLLYYSSRTGRPSKREIAHVAGVLAESRIREAFSNGEGQFKVRGRRAVVHPEIVVPTASVAVFLVSNRVWFNNNRSVRHFPGNDEQRVSFLQDINDRLPDGMVSFER